MAKLSLYDECIKLLDKSYQELKAQNAAQKVLLALDNASVNIELAKDGGIQYVTIALKILINAGLVEEADTIFQMWW